MFLEITTDAGARMINLNLVRTIDCCLDGRCVINGIQCNETYEDVKALIEEYSKPKILMGGYCED